MHTQNVATSKIIGFSLIEVLIASLILASGITTFLFLQIQSLNNTRLAGLETQANLLLSDIINSARANIVGAELGAYNLARATAQDLLQPTTPCDACSATALANQDVALWLSQVAEQIPDSEVALSYTAPEFRATIAWPSNEFDPQNEARSGTIPTNANSGPAMRAVTITTQLCTVETVQQGANQGGTSQCFR